MHAPAGGMRGPEVLSTYLTIHPRTPVSGAPVVEAPMVSAPRLIHTLCVAGVLAVAAAMLGACGRSDDPDRATSSLSSQQDLAMVVRSCKFDRSLWDGSLAPTARSTERHRIADRLVACGLLQGRRREVVVRLLGPPSNYVAASRQQSWTVGRERGGVISIDNEHLVVDYDERWRVVAVRLTTD